MKQFLRICSLVLVIVLMCNMLPMSVFAENLQATTSDMTAEAVPEETAQPVIVEEITQNRTEYSKQFKLSNGFQLAMVYPEAVHYEQDGAWAEIDNRLIAKADGAYTNTAGVWDVRFPRQLSGSNSVTIEKEGYSLSFSLDGELKSTGTEIAKATQDSSTETLTASAAKLSTAAVIPVDTESMKESAQYPETVPDKNLSRLSYQNVFTDTNILYDLQANTVKESIVLKRYNAQLRGYRYTLNVGQLIPVLLENGQIDFYDANRENIVMSMPAPYMVDGAGEYCGDIQVQLTGKGSTYILTYLLSTQWLADSSRAWPVIVDPVVSADLSRSNIEDRTVSQTNDNGEGWGMNACGYSAKYGVHRCYLQYLELPELTSSDVVIAAEVAQYKAFESSTITTVEVHKVTQPWRSANITWSNKPTFNTTIEDYAIVDDVAWYSWDVTDIVRDWYANKNTGMMFKASDAIETGGTDNFKQFLSENYGVAEFRPQLAIYFRNNNGLESYWDYTSSSAGRAGTGYVNDFTGNLVWIRSDMGFDGNRMPVSIQHVYNANDSTAPSDENNSNDTGGNYFGLGNGWRTNYHQRIYQWSTDSKYYVWEDSDGTDHYFRYKSSNTYEDEDGLELTLTTGGSGNSTYKLTDKNGNISYFDSYGRLVKLENNQATKSSVNITYTTTSGPLISTIKDGINRVYSFTYSSGLLTRISFKGSNNTEHSYVTFGYSGTNLTRVTDKDGKYSSYTYSGNILTSASDIDGYKLTYTYNAPPTTWQPYRVTGVAESHNGTSGGTMTIEYAHNQTTFKDHNNNVVIKQFNDFGNTVSTQDGEGHAQYAQYAFNTAAEKDANTDATKKGNQLRLASNMQNTVGNRLRYSSAETGNDWTAIDSAVTVLRTTEAAYIGNYSIKLVRATTGAESGIYSDSLAIGVGHSYTFSAYVKTGSGSVYLGINDGSTTVTSDILPANSDWTRLNVTYTNTGTATKTATVRVLTKDAGTTYIDCGQMETNVSASRYNLIENGDFRYTTTGWTSNGFSITAVTDVAPKLQAAVVRVIGSPTATKQLSQTVPVSGAKDDTLVLSGWAKGDSAPIKDNRTFGMTATFNYTDGTTSDAFKVSFNPDADSSINWQYAAIPIVAKKAYKSVTVKLCYDYNVNTAYFDGIQLYKEEFGSSYTYDGDGNVTSVVDLQKQKTTYEYSNNNLTKMVMPTGASYTYIYDNYHNVKTATSAEGQVYSFTYDTYGNNTKVSITGGGSTISSSAAYSNSGNTLASTTDALGKVTTYGYNAQTNVLEWVQYPKDTETTRTEYSYDSMYRIATAAATTDTGLELSASYTYDNDLLKSIQTPTTAYNFTYGNFGLRSSVKVGTQTLATYSYTNDRNFYLQSLDYGNGDSVDYTYDSQGRLTSQTYEDGDKVTYQYDNDGALAVVTDSATGITTRYYYDFTGRTMKYTESASGYSHSVGYDYDDINNLISQVETINGTTHTTSYTYDKDNRVKSKTTDGITVSYTYDALGRITQQVTKNGSTTILTESYTYTANSSQIHTYRTVSSGYDVTYTYTYDDNGNILSVSDGTNTTSYVYDSQNQLIRENNQAGGFTHVWAYDNAGNIQSRTEYAYTEDTLENVTPTDTVLYGYGEEDANWRDQLLSYDGIAIEYDKIGNPESYRDKTLTWEHGRELTTLSDGNVIWTYAYDANGMRTKKTDGRASYTYVYNGDKLVRLIVDAQEYFDLYFTYDANGIPLTITENGVTYYYVTNLQGDVIGIIDESGEQYITYTYDAWGKDLTHTNTQLADYNPLRYRGYVYDFETGLYYLQSRYYDPEIGRWINADVFPATGQDIVGNNMFVYCGNNPIIRIDADGYAWETIWDIVSLAASVAEVVANPADPWAWAGLIGDVVDVALPCVGGLGEAVDAVKTSVRVIESGDNIIDAAKTYRRVSNSTDEIKKATGAYVVLYEGGQHYIGKGGFARAIQSATEHMTDVNKASAIIWAPTSSVQSAFVTEFLLQSTFGVGRDVIENYNKIWSPGKNIFSALQRGG